MDRKRILIIEDDNDLLHLYRKVLENAGYVVHGVRSVGAGMDLLEQYPFVACICDIIMHENSGLNMLGQLTLLDTDGTQLVMISGWEQYRHVCKAFGVPFYLKPVSNRQLVEIVASAAATQETPVLIVADGA